MIAHMYPSAAQTQTHFADCPFVSTHTRAHYGDVPTYRRTFFQEGSYVSPWTLTHFGNGPYVSTHTRTHFGDGPYVSTHTRTHFGDGPRIHFRDFLFVSFCCTYRVGILHFMVTNITSGDGFMGVKTSDKMPILHAGLETSMCPTMVDCVQWERPDGQRCKSFETLLPQPHDETHPTSPLHDIGIYQLLDECSLSTLASILKHCGKTKSLLAGRFVHAHIKRQQLNRDRFLGNCLVEMYGVCGSVKDARRVFDSLPSHNSYSWNIMINAYAKNGHGKEALGLFHLMVSNGFDPDYCTFICTLNACTCPARLQDVHDIHAVIVSCGCIGELEVENALIAVYGRCGSLCGARSVFSGMLHQNVVSWNALVAACVQNEHSREALDVFWKMQLSGYEPDQITLTSALNACASIAALKEGQKIHVLTVENGCLGDATLMTALVNMYGKCGSFSGAKSSFSQICQRDLICWNAFISACNDNGNWEMALNSLHQMQGEGFKPDHITFVYMLDACASLALLAEGHKIHAEIVDGGYERDLVLSTALMNMYGKCGIFPDAKDVFDEMAQQDVVSWSAIITACAQNGQSKEALDLFHQMRGNGIKPDQTTFLSILTACNHAGWVDDGMHHFLSMYEEHSIPHAIEHYMCMVDLLGRAGHLADAERLISTMPFEQNAAIWSCLLGACRIHGDELHGIRAAKCILKIDSKMAASYVMLSNVIYAAGKIRFEEFEH